MKELWSRRAGAAPVTNQSHSCSFTILLTAEAKTNQRSLSWTLPHPECKHWSQSCTTFSADTLGGAGWTLHFLCVPFMSFIKQFLSRVQQVTGIAIVALQELSIGPIFTCSWKEMALVPCSTAVLLGCWTSCHRLQLLSKKGCRTLTLTTACYLQ